MTLGQLQQKIARWKFGGKKIAFTNGVFDILHQGHLASLSQAAAEGDYLVVAINSDSSVKRLKGESRPVNDENRRAIMLAHLLVTDSVIIFEDDTPLQLIKSILPDVIVKGGDYTPDQIAGAKEVIANGGKVVINPLVQGLSTTGIIRQIQQTK